MAAPHDLAFAPAEVLAQPLAGGGMLLRSPRSLAPYERHLGEMLRRSAEHRPEAIFLAERSGMGWRAVCWGEVVAMAEAAGQALLERGLGPERPVMVLSGNSVDHALLMLGAHLAGVPVAPVSPAYSLLSHDHAKLRAVFEQVRPGLVFIDAPDPYESALAHLDLAGVELASSRPGARATTLLTELLDARPGAELAAAETRLGPDTVAKILFTSGSTGQPKGVLNTHRMLCSNQQMITQCWPFLHAHAPILVDWLPWSHTFGANHNFNMVLKHAGTLYIDAGKPRPDAIGETVRNLREISPTLYFNVPAGFAQLLPHLESDPELCQRFFARLLLVFYAGAALPQDLWERLENLSIATLGRKVAMVSAWGSTETSPLATSVHFPIERAGVIGLPPPGVEIKLVPAGAKQELRVKGPNVTPGYLHDPELTAAAFDEEGFYKIGDAGRLVDPADPSRGLAFDGRVAENFKLLSGTWVHVGELRVQALAAAAPVLQDAVVTGHDRAWVGLLAWLNLAACRDLERAQIVEQVRRGLERHNAENPAGSTRIERVLLLEEPPQLDSGEITDKGYVNQRATLESRAEHVERLYQEPAAAGVIVLGTSG